MNTLDIAKEFVALLKEGKHAEAGERFYAPGIVSIDTDDEGAPLTVEGVEAAVARTKEFEEAYDIHEVEVEGPYVNGDHFIVEFEYDVTEKESDERMEFEEMALYAVRDGKIVEERIFASYDEGDEDEVAEADDEDEEDVADAEDEIPEEHRQG